MTATEYRINPQSSTVSIYVYSDGPLARLGHNHVMTTTSLSGSVSVRDADKQADFELSFPVAQMTVDDPEARRQAGADFPPGLTASDIAGTRKNMLRREVLDAENHPLITLKSVRSSGPPLSPQITVRITIKGASHDQQVAALVKFQGNSLTASGEFDILQSDFGIKPFSIAFGALRIDDRLHVKFSLTADPK